MDDIQGDRIRVNDAWFGIEQRGSKDAPAFVLIHGFTGSVASWGAHLDVFAAFGLRVIALDMLGHGRSDVPPVPSRYRIHECCEDILAIMHALDIQKGEATLLGYSMGGRIALYTAFSGFFRNVILESASPGIDDKDEQYRRYRSDDALADLIEREGMAEFVDIWERIPLFESQKQLSSEARATLHEQRMRNSERGLANSLRGVGTGQQPSLRAKLPELTLPVLLIAGELDSKFSGIAREMAAALPHAQLAIIPGAGHTVHLERPAAFDRIVLEFLSM